MALQLQPRMPRCAMHGVLVAGHHTGCLAMTIFASKAVGSYHGRHHYKSTRKEHSLVMFPRVLQQLILRCNYGPSNK